MTKEGVEPSRTFARRHLKTVRLPFRHLAISVFRKWSERESNSHELSLTRPSTVRVYQFRHQTMKIYDEEPTGVVLLIPLMLLTLLLLTLFS